MKRPVLYIGSFCLLLALFGCGGAPAAARAEDARTVVSADVAAAAPVETAPETAALGAETVPLADRTLAEREAEEAEYEDEDRILGHCLSILDRLPYRADLDGDGQDEIVDLTALLGESDDCLRWAVSLTKGEAVKLFQTDVPEDMPHDLWVGDLDEDGGYEIFFHGDLASYDYLIYAFRSDLSILFFEPDDRFVRWNENEGISNVFVGFIEGFEDGHIIVEGAVDMLGTHFGVRTLAIGDDGVIGPVSSAWEFEEDDDRYLTVTKELTAYAARVRKDPGEAFILAVGEKLYPLASDGFSRLWFKTGSGRTGVLLLTPDEDCMWRIDGAPESEYFESLPYSG